MTYAYIIGGIIFLVLFVKLAIIMRKEYRELEEAKDPCPTFPFFGAPYHDAICIDGWLWDLDMCNDDGSLYGGGDHPCPFCNSHEFKQNLIDIGNYTEEEADNYINRLKDKYEYNEK